jgi:prepilin-type N-terminal cleavage/methylation domain-containing protein
MALLKVRTQKGFTLLELLVVAAIIAIIAAIAIPQLLNARRAAWMSRAKGTLRSIGSAELAYQSGNNKKAYGSFDALQASQDIAQGYSLSNMIENYSMSWTVSSPYTGTGGNISNGGIASNKFTVIAWPRDTRRGFLNTFAVTEEQVVRIFNDDPNSGNVLGSVNTWDPIL